MRRSGEARRRCRGRSSAHRHSPRHAPLPTASLRPAGIWFLVTFPSKSVAAIRQALFMIPGSTGSSDARRLELGAVRRGLASLAWQLLRPAANRAAQYAQPDHPVQFHTQFPTGLVSAGAGKSQYNFSCSAELNSGHNHPPDMILSTTLVCRVAVERLSDNNRPNRLAAAHCWPPPREKLEHSEEGVEGGSFPNQAVLTRSRATVPCPVWSGAAGAGGASPASASSPNGEAEPHPGQRIARLRRS